MENSNGLYRALFLMDDTISYTNEFYISEFVKIVLYNEGYFALPLSDIHSKITDLTSLEYTEEEILHAISIWNNGEIEIENDLYTLSQSGAERFSRKRKSNDLKVYIDLFLAERKDKYDVTKSDLEQLLERFIYQRFNENIKEISDILNHCLEIDNCDKKYSDAEKEIINDFLSWDNIDKNECIYRLIAKAYDYCMINSKCQSQEMIFSKIHFYLDTNIIFRLMGINGSERKSSIKSLVEKSLNAGIKLVVSNFVIEECEHTINSQLDILVESTKTMNKLIPPSTMSFAEEKSIKLDFYRRYYDWVKSGNKHRNYDGFRKCVINEFKELLKTFYKDDMNISFKIISASNFKSYYDSLYDSKMDKRTTETDINSIMLIFEKRNNTGDGQEYFLISADQRLVTWSREVFPGQKSFVDFPSVWLSIILKYTGREKDTDYKAFCQFIHLSIEPQTEDLEKKIAIKANIICTDIDDDIKTMMIEDVRDNYNQYKNLDTDEIVRISYAKSKETIEAETEQKKEQEFDERLADFKKDYDERFEQHQRELEKIKEESKNSAIDAYKQGRQDLANEQKNETIDKKISRTIMINKFLRKIIKGVMWVSLISATVSLILLAIFGLLKPEYKIAKFINENGWLMTIISALVGAFGILIDIPKLKEKVLPVDEKIVRKKFDK